MGALRGDAGLPFPWPFRDAPNTAVFTTRQILAREEPILLVCHDDDDGAWQFHSNRPEALLDSDARLVALSRIVELDRTVAEVADLEPGRKAWRVSRESPWIFGKELSP